MWPEPNNTDVVARMRTAHAVARAALDVLPVANTHEAWGWHGRTLSQPVTKLHSPAWLRVACAPIGRVVTTFWDGSIEAESAMPASVPRPKLRRWHDWNDQCWEYRAELYDHATVRPAATTPVLTTAPDLPTAWWAAVRVTLNDVASVRTSRLTIHQSFLDHTMPRLLGTPIDTTAPRPWTTAHGDFHFANISAPTLCLFDFEGWGLAPAGYDAATLHSYSLLVPPIADRIRTELVEMLDTPSGRFAELVTITELLHATTRGDHLALAEPLRRRASILLGRTVPVLT
ncbi:MAG: aminoglycoside phosphotransferase [Pseudonocardiaceae bacterium]